MSNTYTSISQASDWFWVNDSNPKDVARVAAWAITSEGRPVGLISRQSADRLGVRIPGLAYPEMQPGKYVHARDLSDSQRVQMGVPNLS